MISGHVPQLSHMFRLGSRKRGDGAPSKEAVTVSQDELLKLPRLVQENIAWEQYHEENRAPATPASGMNFDQA